MESATVKSGRVSRKQRFIKKRGEEKEGWPKRLGRNSTRTSIREKKDYSGGGS